MTYTGERDSKYKRHGHGTVTFTDGSTYTGEFKDGRRFQAGSNSHASITDNATLIVVASVNRITTSKQNIAHTMAVVKLAPVGFPHKPALHI